MLSMAESEPLGCAFGVTKDKKDCMLLVEKSGSAKRVAAKSLPLDMGTIRFGTVDPALPDDRHWTEDAYNGHKARGFEQGWTAVAEQLAALAEAET